MDHREFISYHNRLIRFKCEGEKEFRIGAIVDLIPYTEKTNDTDYVFIPRENMLKWREAEQKGDRMEMTKLQEIIDISKIIQAESLYKAAYDL